MGLGQTKTTTLVRATDPNNTWKFGLVYPPFGWKVVSTQVCTVEITGRDFWSKYLRCIPLTPGTIHIPEDPWDWHIYLLYIYHKHHSNYNIHGSYGLCLDSWLIKSIVAENAPRRVANETTVKCNHKGSTVPRLHKLMLTYFNLFFWQDSFLEFPFNSLLKSKFNGVFMCYFFCWSAAYKTEGQIYLVTL